MTKKGRGPGSVAALSRTQIDQLEREVDRIRSDPAFKKQMATAEGATAMAKAVYLEVVSYAGTVNAQRLFETVAMLGENRAKANRYIRDTVLEDFLQKALADGLTYKEIAHLIGPDGPMAPAMRKLGIAPIPPASRERIWRRKRPGSKPKPDKT